MAAATAPLRVWIALIVLALGSALAMPARAQPAETYSVESVKAAFLYRFLDYVEWPESAQSEGPLTIAVLGDDNLAAELRRNVEGRTAHGREVRVHSLSNVPEKLDADVLFVSARASARLSALSREHRRDPVLVVSDGEGALEHGSVINFLVMDGNVRFEVSLPAAERRGLKLSSRLLSVALRVEKSGHRFEPPGPETPERYAGAP